MVHVSTLTVHCSRIALTVQLFCNVFRHHRDSNSTNILLDFELAVRQHVQEIVDKAKGEGRDWNNQDRERRHSYEKLFHQNTGLTCTVEQALSKLSNLKGALKVRCFALILLAYVHSLLTLVLGLQSSPIMIRAWSTHIKSRQAAQAGQNSRRGIRGSTR